MRIPQAVVNRKHQQLKVLFSCSSVGITHRGIESFFRESFDNLRELTSVKSILAKGGGCPAADEKIVWCLPKTSRFATLLGCLTRRSPYAVEQWTSFLPVFLLVQKFKPDVIFSSDANLMFLLRRIRRFSTHKYTILFSNGGPCGPPFTRMDFVHQVAPEYYRQALDAGESCEKHFMVPYGIEVPDGAPLVGCEERRNLRQKLGLPLDKRIVLSVGWIAAEHKRMDYLVNEVAQLPSPPYVLMLGQMDDKSASIIKLAEEKLGPRGFTARCVPYEHVADYYKAANIFALCSLKEGFGRVYLEALIHGLPVLAHDNPVMHYVLAREGIFGDFSRRGRLAERLSELLKVESESFYAIGRRRESVRSRFSWPVLASDYEQMFLACAHPSRTGSSRAAQGVRRGDGVQTLIS